MDHWTIFHWTHLIQLFADGVFVVCFQPSSRGFSPVTSLVWCAKILHFLTHVLWVEFGECWNSADTFRVECLSCWFLKRQINRGYVSSEPDIKRKNEIHTSKEAIFSRTYSSSCKLSSFPHFTTAFSRLRDFPVCFSALKLLFLLPGALLAAFSFPAVFCFGLRTRN